MSKLNFLICILAALFLSIFLIYLCTYTKLFDLFQIFVLLHHHGTGNFRGTSDTSVAMFFFFVDGAVSQFTSVFFHYTFFFVSSVIVLVYVVNKYGTWLPILARHDCVFI
jgi:hypothetical protein